MTYIEFQGFINQSNLLSSSLLDELKEVKTPNPHIARNLVLDIFAVERSFVRTFQQYVDSGLESSTGKNWAWAVNAEHDWAFRSMGTQVIDRFDDSWKSFEIVHIIRIMNAIGSWRKYTSSPKWEERIETHLIYLYKNTASAVHTSVASSMHKYHQDITSSSLSHENTAPGATLSAARISIPSTKLTGKPSKTSPDRSGLGFAGASLFLLICTIGILSNTKNASNTSPSEPGRGTFQDEVSSIRSSLQSKLTSHQSELNDARLMCQYSSAEQKFLNLSVEANAQRHPDIADIAKSEASRASQKIMFLNQKGKYQDYTENCDVGIGYQLFDNYNWVEGSDFKGTLFLVAKRDCLSPSVMHRVLNSKTGQELYYHSIPFSPSTTDGTQRVNFSIPGSALGDSESVDHKISAEKCN